MISIVILLAIVIVILIIYIIIINLQITNVNKQIELKLKEKNTKHITVQLVNKKLINLTKNINRALNEEKKLRINSVRNENEFKEMIANISHDLRTPLTAIRGYLQLMQKNELSKEQRHRLDIAYKHSKELSALVDHFFEYSRLINHQVEAKLEKINLSKVITECIIAVIPIFEEKNIKIIFDDSNTIVVMADNEMLIRIIQNLLGNCIKYASSDVKISTLQDGDYVRVIFSNEVQDIEKVDIEKVFDRFYLADTARKQSGGLGLAIVKTLAERMNGKAEAFTKNDIINIAVYLPLYK